MNVEETINYILDAFHEKKNSHAFLLSSNNLDKCYKDVINIVKKINCIDGGVDGCTCNRCRTIDTLNNPDVLTINPDGKEVKKDQVMDIIRMFSTKPMINEYSVYIINEADKMNESAANKILKFLEEPEGKIIGFFITENVQGVIPTIRSRCELYNFKYDANNILGLLDMNEVSYGKYFDYSMELIYKLNDSPDYVLMAGSKSLSSKDRTEVLEILNLIRKIYNIKYENLIYGKYDDKEYVQPLLEAITTDDLKIIVKRVKLLDNIINDFNFNVNKDLYINKLFILWE